MSLSIERPWPDAPTNHRLLRGAPMTANEPVPSKAASDLAAMIQETQSNLALVLERVATATKRGLDDSLGASSGGGEPVGGTRDFTQAMLDKLGGGGSKQVRNEKGEVVGTITAPLEQDDEARKHLSLLVAAIGAVRDWSTRAKTETFRLTPLSVEKAKLLLGDGPSKCGNPNCGRDVWRTPQDRLRAGRCEPCYRWWDRKERNEERPRNLCHPEERKESA